jgi:L,D-peptidoglycan transpeptidase YkuD (ErfK/YbiS/YcfS/YnhG family)
MEIVVDTAARALIFDGQAIPCAIGRDGACPAAEKREGDGMTPLGVWPIRAVLFRPGRAAPPARLKLPWRWIRSEDGWSDDPADPCYNRPVRHPRGFSAERLWREDRLYDLVVTLGHNDAPPVAGLGSAIFLHCWKDARPTEGCVAVEKAELLALLPMLEPGTALRVG